MTIWLVKCCIAFKLHKDRGIHHPIYITHMLFTVNPIHFISSIQTLVSTHRYLPTNLYLALSISKHTSINNKRSLIQSWADTPSSTYSNTLIFLTYKVLSNVYLKVYVRLFYHIISKLILLSNSKILLT